MKKLLVASTVVAVTAAGCSDPSSDVADALARGAVSEDGYTASATIRPAGAAGQYKTEITIERTERDGSRTLLAEPWVVSYAGQPADLTFEATCSPEDLRVVVSIPALDDPAREARIDVGIYDGEIVAAQPVLVLALPD